MSQRADTLTHSGGFEDGKHRPNPPLIPAKAGTQSFGRTNFTGFDATTNP